MKHNISDKRTLPKGKSLPNRERLKDRVSDAIRESVNRHLEKGGITDILKDGSKKIRVKGGGNLNEPRFVHGEGGDTERVLPGNKKFKPGNRIKRPQKSGGKGGREASADGEGEDSFLFELSKEEILEIFFDGCELPNMNKLFHEGQAVLERRRAGFSVDGPPSKVDLLRTMKMAIARNIAKTAPIDKEVRELEKERDDLMAQLEESDIEDKKSLEDSIKEIGEKIVSLTKKRKKIFCFRDVDIRYRLDEEVKQPIAKAVVFFLMDVSGSMGEIHKELAKRFFILFHLFLSSNYDEIKVVFIRHTHVASECDEDTFFHSRETGGTVVSTSLEVMKDIVARDYPKKEWNIYVAQASDGDNLGSDNDTCYELLVRDILPMCQYYAYIEVWDIHEAEMFPDGASETRLWQMYNEVKKVKDNLVTEKVTKAEDVISAFLKLFHKEKKGEAV